MQLWARKTVLLDLLGEWFLLSSRAHTWAETYIVDTARMQTAGRKWARGRTGRQQTKDMFIGMVVVVSGMYVMKSEQHKKERRGKATRK